ncbi:hypothetical protein [Devosia sp.]|uniref:hypothetical protein n=1 Tax=Devosia sp. TaxID=1871048 RepID=UPI0027348B93|nr:hypothetical protein [Devosia sp.]MDP2779838.1 hypothetical protein [Devosia sp.]
MSDITNISDPAVADLHGQLIALTTMLKLALSLHIGKLPESERLAVYAGLDRAINGPIEGADGVMSTDAALLAFEHMRTMLTDIKSTVTRLTER